MTGVKFPGKEVKAVSKLGFTAIAFKLNAIIKSQVFFFFKAHFYIRVEKLYYTWKSRPFKMRFINHRQIPRWDLTDCMYFLK